MIKKEYLSPQAEEMYLKMEGPLCTSGEVDGLSDFTLLDEKDIVWD